MRKKIQFGRGYWLVYGRSAGFYHPVSDSTRRRGAFHAKKLLRLPTCYANLVRLAGINARETPVRCPSGLRSTPGKRVYVNSVPRVRIPPSPPESVKQARFPAGLFVSASVDRAYVPQESRNPLLQIINRTGDTPADESHMPALCRQFKMDAGGEHVRARRDRRGHERIIGGVDANILVPDAGYLIKNAINGSDTSLYGDFLLD